MPKVLVIGSGNSRRGDHNIGCHVAQRLDWHYHDDPDVRVIDSYQIAPEMVENVAASEFVLFLDAATGQTAAKIETATVTPQSGPASFVHHLNPAFLLSAAMELYGSAPRAQLLTIVGAAFELRDHLSPAIARRPPGFFEQAQAIVESSRHWAARELAH